MQLMQIVLSPILKVPRIEDDDEQEGEPQEVPETRIEVEMPHIRTQLGKNVHFVKLPNFLSVETRYTILHWVTF